MLNLGVPLIPHVSADGLNAHHLGSVYLGLDIVEAGR